MSLNCIQEHRAKKTVTRVTDQQPVGHIQSASIHVQFGLYNMIKIRKCQSFHFKKKSKNVASVTSIWGWFELKSLHSLP